MIFILFYLFLSIVIVGKMFFKNYKYKIEISLFILLLGIMVINFPIGPDLPSYVFSFNRVSSPIADAFKYNMQRNVGFNILLYSGKQIQNNYIMFRSLFNIIVVSLCGYTIYKHSKSLLFSSLIFLGAGYYIVYFGSGIRQMMAMAIFFFAYFNFLLEKKDISYLVSSIIALSFHEAGMICFLVYIVHKLYKYFWKAPIKIFLTFSVLAVIFAWLSLDFLPNFANKYQYISIFTHVLTYLNNISFDVFGIILRTVLIVIDIGLFYFVADKDQKSKEMILTMLFIYVFYIALSGFGIVARIYDFVAIIEVIMIPYFIDRISKQSYRLISTMLIIGINLVLMANDIRFACNSDFVSSNFDFGEFPYLTVFDTNTIEQLME